MQGETLTISTPDGAFQALVRRPDGGGHGAAGGAEVVRPAVVVIQEIFGVNHTVREVCDALAADGFIAVAPDLFWRFEPGIVLDDRKPEEQARAFDLFPRFDIDKGDEDIAATLAATRTLAGVGGKVGAVGFCLGGLLAFLTAARTDADASVGYYGVNIDAHLGEKEKIAHPLMLHIAQNDHFVPPDAQERIRAGLADDRDVEVHVYPGVDHAFARRSGDHYDEQAARAADRRTHDFLRLHLDDDRGAVA